MKKLLFLVLFFLVGCFVCVSSSAQSLRFGVKAGIGMSKFDYKPDMPVNPEDNFSYFGGPRNKEGGEYKPTYSLGGVIEYDVSKDFILSAGIQAASKFSSFTFVSAYSDEPNRYRFNVAYLQLPVMVHYRHKQLFAGAGVYAGSAIYGKWKNEVQNSDHVFSTFSGKLSFGNDPIQSNLPRFDVGLRGEIGYGFKQFRLNLTFDQGLSRLKATNGEWAQDNYISNTENGVLRNQAIYLSATYYWLAK